MFELEDFDLDDEVFLNTQIPIFIDEPLKRSSNSNVVTLNLGENDETFHNISNSVFEVEAPSHFQNIKLENKSSTEQNKNISKLYNGITNNISITEQKLKNAKQGIECQFNKNKLDFNDGFDSDDEAFFNTPDIVLEPISLQKSNDYTEMNLINDHGERVSSFISERHKSILNSSNTSHKSILNFSDTKSSSKSNFNDNLNTTVTSVKSMTPLCSSRKFPGPAGLLSENEDLYSEDPSNLECLDMSINITENDKKEENLCTQANDSSFSLSPYQQFLSDFFTTDVDVLLDKYNVAWIKQKLLPYIASGRFFTYKIPFFVCVVKEIDCLSPDPTVLLADKTGHIRGTVHRAVWNQFGNQLKLGAVLVLSKVGVSCQKIVKGFTLNITNDHLIAIYSFSSENVQEVIVTRTTDLTNEEIVNDAKQWNLLNVEPLNNTPHSEIKSQTSVLGTFKFNNISLNQNSQLSNTNYYPTINNTPDTSTPVKSIFKPKTAVAHNLLRNNTWNSPEEPPAKRIRNEKNSNNDLSIIQNIFEGINGDEMFDDFCC